ncbi:NAD+ kinase [Actinomycetospora succinea]|uniref:NAD kinase n=1 Tax=Actinomycetospora succinea TaxID=663603 RepID=A0A4R6VAK2_9PSEU|nr:NAD(+)/NADH kinase [Actinomycetospora succinea]TDQ58695.1 NAD+ kinase [Actinomycetospora succinea]
MGEVACVGVVVHPTKDVDASLTTLRDWAAGHGVEVVAREAEAARVPAGVTVLAEPDFLARVDAVVSLGGDGTMLGAMRLTIGRPVPVLGVNHGNVGFLVEVSPPDLEGALDRLAEHRFVVEPHAAIEFEHDAGTVTAFNDVVVGADVPGGSVELDLEVEGTQFGYYRCDALVLATPTGSTAYNYAAGGPVISPAADVLALTPVAPMSGVSHSIVLPAGDTVRLRQARAQDQALVRVDGVATTPFPPGAVATARLRPEAAQVVRIDPDRHAQRSRIKLSLLDLPLRREQLAELLPSDVREDLAHLRGRKVF